MIFYDPAAPQASAFGDILHCRTPRRRNHKADGLVHARLPAPTEQSSWDPPHSPLGSHWIAIQDKNKAVANQGT